MRTKAARQALCLGNLFTFSGKDLSFQQPFSRDGKSKEIIMFDPVSIAAIAAPYLAKGAEALAKTAGEKLGGIVGDLAQAVADKFKGDSYAEQTLAGAQ